MDAIDRPPEDASGKSIQRGVRARASYSLAPCAHLFVGFISIFYSPRGWRADRIWLRLTAYGVSRAGEFLLLV